MASLMTLISIIILVLIVFGLSLLFLKKIVPNLTYRVVFSSLIGIIIGLLLYFGIILLIFASMEYYPNRKFDKKAWDEQPDKRYEYTEKLIEREMLIGKDSTELYKMLGKPTFIYNDTVEYNIGQIPKFMSFDQNYLQVIFRSDTVNKASVITVEM